MILNSIFISLLISLVTAKNINQLVQNYLEIHENLSSDEQLVPMFFPRLQKRSLSSRVEINFNISGRHININLLETQGILMGYETPLYFLKSKGYNSPQLEYITKKFDKMHLYENVENKAAVVIKENPQTEEKEIYGVLAKCGLKIRPLQSEYARKIRRHRRSIDNIPKSLRKYYHYHIISKFDPEIFNNMQNLEPFSKTNENQRSKRSTVNTVYPEILVVVDPTFYKIFNNNIEKLFSYLLTYWNSVDMKFRGIISPPYKLNIAGIIIATDENALPYIEKNKCDSNSLKSKNILVSIGSFWYKLDSQMPIDSYDILITMTGYKICEKSTLPCDSVGGRAYRGGACVIDHNGSMTYKNGIIHDDGVYKSIVSATHELGHLLGAVHDGQTTEYPFSSQHIMSTQRAWERNSSYWSDSSLSLMNEFLKKPQSSCLFNKPTLSKIIPLRLPGQNISIDQQCKQFGQENWVACKNNNDICGVLKCTIGGKCFSASYPILDGTPCSKDKICLRNKCIRKPSHLRNSKKNGMN